MKIAKERIDIFPGGEAPAEYRKAIAQAGGLNPYGEPNFRLTLAEKTRWYQGGEWHEWPKGAALKNRGGMFVDVDGRMVKAPPDKPIRVVCEMRWELRYPTLKGWIFQEWFPAHRYGDPNEWSTYTVPGHKELCRLGPYPTRGDYELALPYGWQQPANTEIAAKDHRFQGNPGLPPISALRQAINYAERTREYWHSLKPAERIRLREDQMLQQEQLNEKRLHDRDVAIHRDAMSPLFSNSLEAGRWREEIVKRAGLKIGHVGN